MSPAHATPTRCLPPGAGHAAQPQPLGQQQDAADRPQAAPIGTSSPGLTSRVSSSRAPSPSSKVPRTIPPRVQRRPTAPRRRTRPGSAAAREHRRDAQQPDEHLGPGQSRSRSSTSTAPTTAAIAAANPSRNPGRGRMARANRSVMRPPVIQNRARKVISRPVLRPPTVMANARPGRPAPAAPSATSSARSPGAASLPLRCPARAARAGLPASTSTGAY